MPFYEHLIFFRSENDPEWVPGLSEWALFPDRMQYKTTKHGFSFYVYLVLLAVFLFIDA